MEKHILGHVGFVTLCMHVICSYNNQIFQIIWGGRWQDGAASGSGEDMEQLFSNLSRWAFSTKMLSAAGM